MEMKQMLELAAKAAGKEGFEWNEFWRGMYSKGAPDWWESSTWWNPLQDDGYCARMETHLGISLVWTETSVSAAPAIGRSGFALFADHGGDKNAARRMASTLAAAYIGEKME